MIVTTSHKPERRQVVEALELARRLKVRYVSRRHLVRRKGETVVVVESKGISALKDDKRLFFHPSLAVIRRSNIKSGERDYLIESLSLNGDESVLDCTLGLGSEAILIAHFLTKGKVVGLEKSKIVQIVVEDGIKRVDNVPKWVAEAVKRIEILNADYKEYVRSTKEKFDCVYVDPMFEHPSCNSPAMDNLRPFVDNSTVDVSDLEFMKKIARKRVVVKARWNDSIFERYEFNRVMGSPKSGISYGVIEV